MLDKADLRGIVRDRLAEAVDRVNEALLGKKLHRYESVLRRLGRGGKAPHWFDRLATKNTLPNLDGKTIGSVVEMLLVAVLETELFPAGGAPPLRVNPARGIDLPDLDLGVKSPSENYCTSEPFFSAYERLLGSEHDAIVLLTDYQEAKKRPPLRLQITKWRYLTKSQIADEGLCRLASKQREWLASQGTAWAKKVFRFLAFVNQSDWRGKKLLKMVDHLRNSEEIESVVRQAQSDFEAQNKKRAKLDRPLLPDSDLKALTDVLLVKPLHLGVVDAVDNWVVEVQQEAGRLPNENEWNRLLTSPLDGKIGMSFALQWRYNFGKLFGVSMDSGDMAEDVVP